MFLKISLGWWLFIVAAVVIPLVNEAFRAVNPDGIHLDYQAYLFGLMIAWAATGVYFKSGRAH